MPNDPLLPPRLVPLKVFAMLIESNKNIFISVQFAYSLEDAFFLAKVEFEKQNNPLGNKPLIEGAKISLFSVKGIDQMVSESEQRIDVGVNSTLSVQENKKKETPPGIIEDMDEVLGMVDDLLKSSEVEISKITMPKLDKNSLMKEIIDKKDIGLFNKNKHLFSIGERKYIKERLK
jgi:hypothetical protein